MKDDRGSYFADSIDGIRLLCCREVGPSEVEGLLIPWPQRPWGINPSTSLAVIAERVHDAGSGALLESETNAPKRMKQASESIGMAS